MFEQKQLEHLQQLAKLSLLPAEQALMLKDLADTLALIESLRAIDVSAIEPLLHPQDAVARLRDDQTDGTDASAELLALAPAAHGGYYLVPSVLE